VPGWLSSRPCVTGSTEVDRAANISMKDNFVIATPNIQNVSDKRNYSVGICCTTRERYRFAPSVARIALALRSLALTPRRRQLDLAQSDHLGRDLDALVLFDVLERLVEAEQARGRQAHQHVGV